jgi:thymidylate synthase ThyX
VSEISARVVAHTCNDYHDIDLITLELVYPRFIHSELMTHRVFSRNAASSRAIPTPKQLEAVRETPAMPERFGANQKGMQDDGHDHDAPVELLDRRGRILPCTPAEAWVDAAETAAEYALAFHSAGYHKQVANRLIEPFVWMKTLVTSTEWDNFFELRDHEAADPTFQELASQMGLVIRLSEPRYATHHLPYISGEEFEEFGHCPKLLMMASANRCKRVSYNTFDGKRLSIEEEASECQDMIDATPRHASPLEHPAVVLHSSDLHSGNFRGWWQFRQIVEKQLPYVKAVPAELVDVFSRGLSFMEADA